MIRSITSLTSRSKKSAMFWKSIFAARLVTSTLSSDSLHRRCTFVTFLIPSLGNADNRQSVRSEWNCLILLRGLLVGRVPPLLCWHALLRPTRCGHVRSSPRPALPALRGTQRSKAGYYERGLDEE